jgi:hypothetical protein
MLYRKNPDVSNVKIRTGRTPRRRALTDQKLADWKSNVIYKAVSKHTVK